MKKKLLIIICLTFLFTPLLVKSQSPKVIGRNNYEIINIDLKNGKFIDNKPLPFDVPFILSGTLPPEVVEIQVCYSESRDKNTTTKFSCNCDSNGTKLCVWKRYYLTLNNTPDNFNILVPPFKPNDNYKFSIYIKRQYNVTELDKINGIARKILKEIVKKEFDQLLQNQNIPSIKESIRTKFIDKLVLEIQSEYKYKMEANKLTKSLLVEMINKVNDNNLNWELLADDMSRINDHLFQKEKLDDNSSFAWEKLFEKIKQLSKDNTAKKQVVKLSLSDSLLVSQIVHDINPSNYQYALKGYYNIDTKKEETQKYLRSSLVSESVIAVLHNQVLFLEKMAFLYNDISTNPDIVKKNDILLVIKDFHEQLQSSINNTKILLDDLSEIDKITNALNIEEYLKSINLSIPINGFTGADFLTRSDYYITADLGFAYTTFDYFNGSNEIFPYAGVNFNFAAINRQAQYKKNNFKTLKHPWLYVQSKKLSAVIGVTFLSIKNSVNNYDTRKGIINVSSKDLGLITSIGYRLGDFGRLSAGVMWAKVRDPNILVNKYYLSAFPCFSISLDLDVKDKLGDLGALIFNKQ